MIPNMMLQPNTKTVEYGCGLSIANSYDKQKKWIFFTESPARYSSVINLVPAVDDTSYIY